MVTQHVLSRLSAVRGKTPLDMKERRERKDTKRQQITRMTSYFAPVLTLCHLCVLFQAFCQRYIELENTLAHYDPLTGTSKRTELSEGEALIITYWLQYLPSITHHHWPVYITEQSVVSCFTFTVGCSFASCHLMWCWCSFRGKTVKTWRIDAVLRTSIQEAHLFAGIWPTVLPIADDLCKCCGAFI